MVGICNSNVVILSFSSLQKETNKHTHTHTHTQCYTLWQEIVAKMIPQELLFVIFEGVRTL